MLAGSFFFSFSVEFVGGGGTDDGQQQLRSLLAKLYGSVLGIHHQC